MELIRRWTRSRSARFAAAVLLGVVAFAVSVGIPGVTEIPRYRIDLDVYRLGGQLWLNGGDLYGQLPPTQAGNGLPFTYPPIAAIIFSVFAWMPLPVASAIVGLTSAATLFGVVWLVVRELSDLRNADLLWFTVSATAVALLLGPVRETFGFGQINIYLMALVVVDVCVGKDKWWRGALTGFAAAIKLTPAVFFLYFLLRKDVRAIVVGGVTFVACHALGFLFAWDDSVTYWTSALTDPSRIGGLAYAANQSINGVLHRLDVTGDATQIVWLALVIAVVGVATVLMVRLIRRRENFAAVVVVALAGLLASPVSWSHHWVWAVPAILVVFFWALRGRQALGVPLTRALGVLVVAGVAIFLATPYWWFPHENDRELGWAWYMHLVGNAFLWWTLALYACMWWFTRRVRPEPQP